MSAFSVREFREKDAQILEGLAVPTVAFGRTLTLDGVPVGYGGVFFPFGDGQAWLFFHVSPDIRNAAKVAICRAAVQGLRQIDGDILTYFDHRKPRSREFLVWCGFEPAGKQIEINGETFEVWRSK
jgi:hypothetical protein